MLSTLSRLAMNTTQVGTPYGSIKLNDPCIYNPGKRRATNSDKTTTQRYMQDNEDKTRQQHSKKSKHYENGHGKRHYQRGPACSSQTSSTSVRILCMGVILRDGTTIS